MCVSVRLHWEGYRVDLCVTDPLVAGMFERLRSAQALAHDQNLVCFGRWGAGRPASARHTGGPWVAFSPQGSPLSSLKPFRTPPPPCIVYCVHTIPVTS